MTDTTNMTERELAEYYNRTEDLSGFDEGAAVPVEPGRRDVTISVRFSAEEIEAVRAAADGVGEKVTAYIRAAALDGAAPAARRVRVTCLVDRLAADLESLRAEV
jgi:uncharacterized protein (DUF1778 family)